MMEAKEGHGVSSPSCRGSRAEFRAQSVWTTPIKGSPLLPHTSEPWKTNQRPVYAMVIIRQALFVSDGQRSSSVTYDGTPACSAMLDARGSRPTFLAGHHSSGPVSTRRTQLNYVVGSDWEPARLTRQVPRRGGETARLQPPYETMPHECTLYRWSVSCRLAALSAQISWYRLPVDVLVRGFPPDFLPFRPNSSSGLIPVFWSSELSAGASYRGGGVPSGAGGDAGAAGLPVFSAFSLAFAASRSAWLGFTSGLK